MAITGRCLFFVLGCCVWRDAGAKKTVQPFNHPTVQCPTFAAMYLERLKLTNFRNYEFQELEFSANLNLIAGLNGMGKTNLLDAVYYLCMSKSQFTNTDRNVVKHGESFFRLEGYFSLNEETEKIVVKVRPGKSKVLERNNAAYDRLADHVGLLPIVFKAPDDTALALDGSEERRRFLDNTLCQIDTPYLRYLLQYNKILQSRNALLKQFGEQRYFDAALVEVYNDQMDEPAKYIHEKRKSLIAQFEPVFNQYYNSICGGQETVKCIYKSQLLEKELHTIFQENQEKDRILQRTTAGIHKDDLQFKMNDRALKTFASQGQLKSFVLALKLAQYEVLKKAKERSPILLLDDLFDKLDDQRVKHLLELLTKNEFGQIFITDTHPERSEKLAKQFASRYTKLIIHKGIATVSKKEEVQD